MGSYTSLDTSLGVADFRFCLCFWKKKILATEEVTCSVPFLCLGQGFFFPPSQTSFVHETL